MSEGERDQTVHKVELLISDLLRIGVSCSLLIVVAGTVLSFAHHPDYVSSPQELAKITGKGAVFPHDLPTIWAEILQGRGRAIIMAGLILLVATPVMRVAVSVFAFAKQRDPAFVVLTTVVFVLLCLSFFMGKAGG
ncbi:MAG: DUF1634 domain-containing protein [Tepidisphaeraceae bacterium]|jgi:uncharacterized membrane protein